MRDFVVVDIRTATVTAAAAVAMTMNMTVTMVSWSDMVSQGMDVPWSTLQRC